MDRRAHYVPVRGINVSLWGKPVGALVPHALPGYYVFEYDSGFLRSGWEISPLKMPLADGPGPYVFTAFGQNAFMGLPGVFADSLPDGFGNSLINEWMRQRGVPANANMRR